MSESCRRCGDKSELMRLRMENQDRHLMLYITIPLCNTCGWELRDKIRDVVRSFTENQVELKPVEDEKKDEEDAGYSFEDFEVA